MELLLIQKTMNNVPLTEGVFQREHAMYQKRFLEAFNSLKRNNETLVEDPISFMGKVYEQEPQPRLLRFKSDEKGMVVSVILKALVDLDENDIPIIESDRVSVQFQMIPVPIKERGNEDYIPKGYLYKKEDIPDLMNHIKILGFVDPF